MNKFFFILFLLIAGCGLFSTREVEPPIDPRSNFTPPTSPNLVMINLQFAIAEKNTNNYMKCFIDSAFAGTSFRYFADAPTELQFPVLANWNINSERIYYTNLVSVTSTESSSNLFLSNDNLITSIDSAIYDADYLLVFNHNRQVTPKTTKGKLRFVLIPDSRNLWGIKDWYDFKNAPEDTTWSFLKASFVN
ncbi:MAG TPA: hypothetical protein DEP28_08560 [Bacteroidetes bacterium]|nr:hypothetical protein [Bacteroidota bacterium]